jgi:hypothetical protein
MKTKLILSLLLAAGVAGIAADKSAAPPAPGAKPAVATTPPFATIKLAADAAVFLHPDAQSPVLTRFKAGALVPLASVDAPAGWRAVTVAGPFDAYVQNKYVGKDLDVKPGTQLHLAPELTSASFGPMSPGDRAELVGLRGDWSKVKLDKSVIGYLAVGEVANLPAGSSRAAPITTTPSPVVTSEPGRPVATGQLTPDTPRLFQGRLVSARRPIINPNPIYDYQLCDSEGRRFAYLDLRRLILVGKIEDYLDRIVAVAGTMRNTVDGTDLVIAAESIQLR